MEIIAEIGINHNGDLGIAKKLIDASAAAGCSFVKFQKRDIKTLFTATQLGKPKDSPWGSTYREYKERLEFSLDQYRNIDFYTRGKIGWFASPWDVPSVKFLVNNFSMPYIKVASASITEYDLLLEIKRSGIPVIISSGMSDLKMLNAAIDVIGKKNIYCIMQCTSTYPTADDDMNLKCIPMFKEMYPWTKIGFSNHHPGITGMQIAAALGAEMIEFHMTLDRAMYGSDQAASIEPQGVFRLVKGIKAAQKMMGDGIKDILKAEMPVIESLRRSKELCV